MRVALTLLACVILSACSFSPGSAGTPTDNSQPSDSPATVSAPRIEPPPVTPATPPGTHLPAFACADTSGGTAGSANLTEARVGEQAGYDRFVLQFNAAVPAYTVTRQAKPTFTASPSGQPITLSGTSGVLVRVHTATGAGTFTGSTDLQQPNFVVLKEARQTQDFEGYVSWALGLSGPACLRTFTLTNPARLVIDFTTS